MHTLFPVIYLLMGCLNRTGLHLLRRCCTLWTGGVTLFGIGWFAVMYCAEKDKERGWAALLPCLEPVLLIALVMTLSMGSFLAMAVEQLGASFAQSDRLASSNYAIDSQGHVGLYVEEANRAWTSSSLENDSQAVTIEVANDETGGQWHVSDTAYARLIDLCVDICRRNGIPELRYTGDETGTLTIHRMFYSGTECPGPYLTGRMEEIAQEVNRRLAED